VRTDTCTSGCVCEKRFRIAGSAYVETIGLGQAHAAAPADEEAGADVTFQRVQARGQGRLREIKRLRGAGDGAATDDLDERFELVMHR
jgi:hypothetical protein